MDEACQQWLTCTDWGRSRFAARRPQAALHLGQGDVDDRRI